MTPHKCQIKKHDPKCKITTSINACFFLCCYFQNMSCIYSSVWKLIEREPFHSLIKWMNLGVNAYPLFIYSWISDCFGCSGKIQSLFFSPHLLCCFHVNACKTRIFFSFVRIGIGRVGLLWRINWSSSLSMVQVSGKTSLWLVRNRLEGS